MADLKFAVLGTGWWSGFQIPAWNEVGGVNLVALYNRTLTKAEKVAAQFNIPRVYQDARDLFKNEKLDFVDIIASNKAHAELVYLAAEFKVPVICQKPMATDWESCQSMVSVCQEAGVPFMIHENFRWQAPVREVKKLIAEGQIGDVYRAHVNVIGYSAQEYIEQPFLKELEQLTLMDIGSHVLDTSRFLFGEPQSLYCQTRRTRNDIKGEDCATVVMQMGNVICNAEMSNATRTAWNHFPDIYMFIEGTKGSIELLPDFYVRLTTDEGSMSRRIEPPGYSWLRGDALHMYASIVPCNANCLDYIRDGVPAETVGSDNIKTMKLVFDAYASAEANQVITY